MTRNLAEETRLQIEQAVRNMGYMSGQVSMYTPGEGEKNQGWLSDSFW